MCVCVCNTKPPTKDCASKIMKSFNFKSVRVFAAEMPAAPAPNITTFVLICLASTMSSKLMKMNNLYM